jgi:alkyl hydroperoxide reductase subunit AhpC
MKTVGDKACWPREHKDTCTRRNPAEILRILDALQTEALCPCNRGVGGQTL